MPVNSSMKSESTRRSVTTVPSDLVNDTPSHFFQCAATGYFAHARNDQAGCIRQKYGIDASAAARLFAQRFERHFPTPGARHLWQYAERKRQQHPRPVHLVGDALKKIGPVGASIHPPQNAQSEQKGQHDL